jgi:hypothetical protein
VIASPPFGRLRIGVVVIALVVGAMGLLAFKLSSQPPLVDFMAMWNGGRIAGAAPARLYDFVSNEPARSWMLRWPFPYPPSALLVFGPLGRLPLWAAGVVWMSVSAALFSLAWLPLFPRRPALAAALIWLAPGAVWAALSGQSAFLIGAMAIAATARLDRQPRLAGLLLGLAMAIKPTTLLMAPLALLAGRRWSALWAMAVAGLVAVALSALLYGPTTWSNWIAVAPAFLSHVIADPRFNTGIIAPTGLAAQFGFSGWAMTAWRAGFAAIGGAIVWRTFRKTSALAPRLTALIGASLLASPYAMNYETTLLAPGAVLALLTAPDRNAQGVALAAYIALAVAGFPGVSPYALLVFLALSLWRLPSEQAVEPLATS